MGFKARFDVKDIRKVLEVQKDRIDRAILSRLELVGWEFVKMARDKTASSGGFNDVTGNLRSSIGFTVLKDGRQIIENFEQSPNGTDKSTGIQVSKRFLRKIVDESKSGYALIVVAGMDYAAAVESRGKDVITGSSLIAEDMLQKALARLKEKVSGK